jgi:2-oxo-4-hydroxy-4-carboxy-5-ureidoimidazoline decarboxylase
LDREKFIEHYGSLYENSSHIALAIYERHNLDTSSPLEIFRIMKNYVNKMDREFKMKLILEHPELGIKKGQQKNLTAHSKKEQNRAGLDNLSDSEYDILSGLNKDYMNKFKFPFIIAVSGLNKEEVFRNIQLRLKNSIEIEYNTALEEIHKIAETRLKNLL